MMTAGLHSCDALTVCYTGFLVYVPLRDMSIGDISLMAPKFEGFTDDTGQVPCSKSRED